MSVQLAGLTNGFANGMGLRQARGARQQATDQFDAMMKDRAEERDLRREELAMGTPFIPPGGFDLGDGGQPNARNARGATRGSSGGGMGRQAFIDMMMPHALRVSEATGVDPRIVIAQAAQETGWGRSAPGNNYFGVKSHGRGGGRQNRTHEYVNGQRVNVTDSFREYADPGESADDYGAFLRENARYAPMLAADGMDSQIDALGRSGYATDPNYASSIRSIAGSITVPSPTAAPATTAEADTKQKPQWGTLRRIMG